MEIVIKICQLKTIFILNILYLQIASSIHVIFDFLMTQFLKLEHVAFLQSLELLIYSCRFFLSFI